jgi:uncharacterized protein YndB with AHSA1/START domain
MNPTSRLKAEDAVVMKIEIAATPEEVFRALTDKEELRAWWVEGGSNNWELEKRVGGKWSAQGQDKSCGNWQLWGEILAFDPPRVLEYTWHEELELERNCAPTVVRYELEAIGNATRLTLTHSGFGTDKEGLERYRGGWPGVLELLQAWHERPAHERSKHAG